MEFLRRKVQISSDRGRAGALFYLFFVMLIQSATYWHFMELHTDFYVWDEFCNSLRKKWYATWYNFFWNLKFLNIVRVFFSLQTPSKWTIWNYCVWQSLIDFVTLDQLSPKTAFFMLPFLWDSGHREIDFPFFVKIY